MWTSAPDSSLFQIVIHFLWGLPFIWLHLPIHHLTTSDQLTCPCWRKVSPIAWCYHQHVSLWEMMCSGRGACSVRFPSYISFCLKVRMFNFDLIWSDHLLLYACCVSNVACEKLQTGIPIAFVQQWLSSRHSSIKDRFVEYMTNSCPVNLWSSSRITVALPIDPLVNAFHAQPVNLGGQPCFGWCAVVP